MVFFDSIPKVVEKGIGMSYTVGKPTNRMGGYAEENGILFFIPVFGYIFSGCLTLFVWTRI
jgi:hypothetical protein